MTTRLPMTRIPELTRAGPHGQLVGDDELVRIANQNFRTLRDEIERGIQTGGLVSSHGVLSGLGNDDHPLYPLVDGTRGFTGVVDGIDPTDPAHLTTRGYLDTFVDLLNGAVIETINIDVVDDGGTTELELEQAGGGDLTFIFDHELHVLDCDPTPASVALTSGTDTVPVQNFVYVTESGGVLTLEASIVGWPATSFAPIATVICQSNASLAVDGAFKVHAWTDHISKATENGHLQHVNRWIRNRPAGWLSGCAAANLSVSAPDAYISVASGVAMQLHEHAFPAIDLNGGHAFLANDPTTPFKRITTLDDITQDASGNGINGKHICLVVWGVVSEDTGDCQLFINLPTNVYNTAASSESDSGGYSVYDVPVDYVGCGFLIARYNVRAFDSGTWVQNSLDDLRGQFPSTEAGSTGGGGAASPLTTKGDLFTYSTDNARLPVGADDEVLVADSGEVTGLRWGSSGGGGSPPGDFDLLTNGVDELVFAAGDVVWIV